MPGPSVADVTVVDAVAAAAGRVEQHGVCHLAAPVLPPATVAELRAEADGLVGRMTEHLAAIGVEYLRQTEPFSYREVASRCRGRIDLRLNRGDHPAFFAPAVVEIEAVMGVVGRLLGSDARLNYAGLVNSFAGSDAQGWHTDGPHLFPQVQLPPHALTVFLPLVDVTAESGPTEFIPGSHAIEEMLALADGTSAAEPLALAGAAGSAVVFDYRLVHRGLANSTQASRPILYLVYSKEWFQDAANLNSPDSVYKCPTPPPASRASSRKRGKASLTSGPGGNSSTAARKRARVASPSKARPGGKAPYHGHQPDVTAFQASVFDLCREVPAGRVTTYKEIARKLSCGSSQAVGQALKHNPFATARFAAPYPDHMVPCHRVISSDFTIGGFSGTKDTGSREICNKMALLRKEGVRVAKKGQVVRVVGTATYTFGA